ncbi:glycosyltransferase family 2 protein [Candidatus Saccharibacteria bacterium]|nr:glycosyltransferase family 2 protein [Candidatus Saccharibacteria bacterium]
MRKCDIIIPIYNAYDCLGECIDSVLKYTDFNKAHLVLIDDKSPDDRVLPLLKKYKVKYKNKITLLNNEENLGFVATVNKGIKLSKNDVVLLNSDAVVSKNWLEKMVMCGEKDKNIATVTPLANNVTPVGLPESFRKRGFPESYNFERMANLVEKYSMHLYPEVPSAHGFCMYIKREAVKKVGYFDEKTFGKGYGEENDFCFRCFEYGYYHVLCDDTYVLHKGSQSFLDKKKFHDDELRQKHPFVRARVDAWYQKQDLKKIVDNVVLAVGVEVNRVNVLIVAYDEITMKTQKVIDELRGEYNFHILEQNGGYYTVHSFFKDVDLMTAIFEKTVAFWGDGRNFGEYKRMFNEVKNTFGISVVDFSCSINKELLLDKCKRCGKKTRLDFEKLQRKMLEYDFVMSILKGIEMKKDEDIKLEQRLTEERKKERIEQLTILQRIYLKIRYILIGR